MTVNNSSIWISDADNISIICRRLWSNSVTGVINIIPSTAADRLQAGALFDNKQKKKKLTYL